MNMQEIFDTVYAHLVNQGEQSADWSGDCLYRDSSGNKCAVGCLINDNYYDEGLEYLNMYHECVQEAVSQSLGAVLKDTSLTLLMELQKVHDDCDVWENNLLHEKMKSVAKAFKLKFNDLRETDNVA